MDDYELENGGTIEPPDEDNDLLLNVEGEYGEDIEIYLTKKDVEHMLTMFKPEGG